MCGITKLQLKKEEVDICGGEKEKMNVGGMGDGWGEDSTLKGRGK